MRIIIMPIHKICGIYANERIVDMNNKKNGLNSLLSSNPQAKTFFGSLPDYVQGGIMLRSEEIFSEEDLHSCADSIFAEFE